MATRSDAPALPGARAVARYVRISPTKARRVVNLVRGLPAQEALTVLQFAPQGASEQVYKVVASAIANAENNERLDPDALLVSEAFVDEGPTLKRFRPRAQGRAYRINKRTCHITVAVEAIQVAPQPRQPVRAGARKAQPAKTTPAAKAATAAATEPAEVDAAAEAQPAKKTAAALATEAGQTAPRKAPAKKAAKKAAAATEPAAEAEPVAAETAETADTAEAAETAPAKKATKKAAPAEPEEETE